ncbi:hypothetical protein J437_LFUL011482 [Ladona fulva]|uniref:Rad51-like C-terminal domain-containing protein n=1 Tax=Ladona fulva TaxID=123851 RepID=A0A8K0KCL5_LADFU|nr:hypothetical protein J437_LFUL011482 [Ladona fulva]
MNYECKAETGVQLLARLGNRPRIKNVDQELFFTNDSPSNGDVLELIGDHSTGKTLLVTQILAHCLLPIKIKVYDSKEVCVGGLGAGAILINTDLHFQIAKLVQIMEHRLRICLAQQDFEANETKTSEYVEKLMKDLLKNIVILNCYDKKYLSANHSIVVVALDSASAFYWQDMSSKNCLSKRMDSYLKSLLSVLEKCVEEFKVLTIFTRPRYFHSKNPLPSKSSGSSANGQQTFKIELSLEDNKEGLSRRNEGACNALQANVHTPSSNYITHYFINSDDLSSTRIEERTSSGVRMRVPPIRTVFGAAARAALSFTDHKASLINLTSSPVMPPITNMITIFASPGGGGRVYIIYIAKSYSKSASSYPKLDRNRPFIPADCPILLAKHTKSGIGGSDGLKRSAASCASNGRRKLCDEIDKGKKNKKKTFGMRLGTWNVKKMNKKGKLENVKREMERYNISILGLSEGPLYFLNSDKRH